MSVDVSVVVGVASFLAGVLAGICICYLTIKALFAEYTSDDSAPTVGKEDTAASEQTILENLWDAP